MMSRFHRRSFGSPTVDSQINSRLDAGYILVVPDRVPFWHFTIGDGTDLHPAVERVLASSDFNKEWEKVKGQSKSEMASSIFRRRKYPKLEIVISRAKKPGEPLGGVRILATATYDLGRRVENGKWLRIGCSCVAGRNVTLFQQKHWPAVRLLSDHE